MSTDSPGLVLLDAAGTLIHPAEPVENVYERYFSQFGWAASKETLRGGFRETFGSLADPDFGAHADGDAAERAWWRQVVEKTAASVGIVASGEAFEECFRALFDHYAKGKAWQVYPEIPSVLKDLRLQGWKLAVVSNFDRRLHRVFEELELTESFDLVLTSADVCARKPSPMLLQKAAASFPEASAICHVGDSSHADGGAATAAGLPFFHVDRPAKDLKSLSEWLKITFP